MSLATKVYEQAQNANQNANASQENNEKNDKGDNVVDAEYEEK